MVPLLLTNSISAAFSPPRLLALAPLFLFLVFYSIRRSATPRRALGVFPPLPRTHPPGFFSARRYPSSLVPPPKARVSGPTVPDALGSTGYLLQRGSVPYPLFFSIAAFFPEAVTVPPHMSNPFFSASPNLFLRRQIVFLHSRPRQRGPLDWR